ncbi:hypothetical protein CEXT_386201 [Caerostris extrusa]|uniref:Uncharacterized protein n=1 Tax=Caerostris extrusa TaxID=172846 RepID=A0AAV4XPP8_CAEEX|nr:hypothetical protein CEXT_386201 [Caerostris extrusa]
MISKGHLQRRPLISNAAKGIKVLNKYSINLYHHGWLQVGNTNEDGFCLSVHWPLRNRTNLLLPKVHYGEKRNEMNPPRFLAG